MSSRLGLPRRSSYPEKQEIHCVFATCPKCEWRHRHFGKHGIQLQRTWARCHVSWVWIPCVGPLAYKLGGLQVGYNKPYFPRTCQGMREGPVGSCAP
ncbi:hypothetical protein TIFTF001_000541 [Ficus carica]|uniref:Uncharacterized protein n=1 Tax=Ficus carica TaxID=3494 RepID=A0AA87YVA8_FICCA|nr:hypothetical protein TIFTF001_000541 [Ficus carica]